MTSSFVSSVGTWMQSVALGIYLTETTRNPLWLGLLTVSAWTPALIGSPGASWPIAGAAKDGSN